ncbi:MAG: pilus assembly protein PilS [Neisseria sp.]|nr:MAG: pilus assembly protein PilS [Neisseria sp.]
MDTACLLTSSFPRRRESRPIRTESYRIKQFPQFHILNARLRGNDG